MADNITNLTYLTCPRCNLVMIPPIYACLNMHGHCEDCKLKSNVCCICFRGPIFPCYHLDNLSRGTIYTCRWQNCTATFPYNEIRKHEYSCQFRIYVCPQPPCRFSSDLEKMMVHIAMQHPLDNLIPDNYYRSEQKMGTRFYMVAFGEIFICQVTVERYLMAWSVGLSSGSYSRARDFQVFLDIWGRRYPVPLCGIVPCFQLDLPHTQLPRDDIFVYVLVVSRKSSPIAYKVMLCQSLNS